MRGLGRNPRGWNEEDLTPFHTGALTGAWAGGAVGAVAGCGISIMVQIGVNRGGKVGEYAQLADYIMTGADIRRGAFKRLGVPTYREIIKTYRGQH